VIFLIGYPLKKLRKAAKLTMKEFGALWGLKESTISLYEQDRREPKFSSLSDFANFFHVSLDYFFWREPFGGAMRRLRKKAGFSISEMARELGMNAQYYLLLEHDEVLFGSLEMQKIEEYWPKGEFSTAVYNNNMKLVTEADFLAENAHLYEILDEAKKMPDSARRELLEYAKFKNQQSVSPQNKG
jgi:transcriptional regulator with XRE-family HTH domain